MGINYICIYTFSIGQVKTSHCSLQLSTCTKNNKRELPNRVAWGWKWTERVTRYDNSSKWLFLSDLFALWVNFKNKIKLVKKERRNRNGRGVGELFTSIHSALFVEGFHFLVIVEVCSSSSLCPQHHFGTRSNHHMSNVFLYFIYLYLRNIFFFYFTF